MRNFACCILLKYSIDLEYSLVPVYVFGSRVGSMLATFT